MWSISIPRQATFWAGCHQMMLSKYCIYYVTSLLLHCFILVLHCEDAGLILRSSLVGQLSTF